MPQLDMPRDNNLLKMYSLRPPLADKLIDSLVLKWALIVHDDTYTSGYVDIHVYKNTAADASQERERLDHHVWTTFPELAPVKAAPVPEQPSTQ